MVTEAKKKIRNYVIASLHYMENALLMIRQGDAGKSGELLWGSVAEALQALALSRGIEIKSHRTLRWFAGEIAKELKDSSIITTFHVAENLHQKGFHEVELDIRDITFVVESIRGVLLKLLSLIPKEIVNIEDIQQNKDKKISNKLVDKTIPEID